ncbi:peptidase C45 [Microbacterium maritypicum]|uniref:C45 family autoproteolytic acyltransferase/hydolase n=1 Tax=Microbacterium maritypicum TaxID=33918 RepID=UPI003D6DF184
MQLLTHVNTATDPIERGRDIGTAFGAEIRKSARLYLDFFEMRGLPESSVRSIADHSFAALAAWSPRLADELIATAEAAEVERWQLAALNARTEVLAAIAPDREGECSTAIWAPVGPNAPQTMQTWDWHDSLCPSGLMLELTPGTAPETGRPVGKVRLFTELGVLGKIGVNDAGIGVHFNILHHESNRSDGGVPVHAIARRILDEARTIAEAEAIARSATVSASTVISVVSRADESPRAVSLELSPAGVATVLPNADGWLLHTNHFLDPVLAVGEATLDRSTTFLRFDHLVTQSPGLADLPVRERARTFAGEAGKNAPVCFVPNPADPPHEQWTTLLTISLDLEEGRLDFSAGSPAHLAEQGAERF